MWNCFLTHPENRLTQNFGQILVCTCREIKQTETLSYCYRCRNLIYVTFWQILGRSVILAKRRKAATGEFFWGGLLWSKNWRSVTKHIIHDKSGIIIGTLTDIETWLILRFGRFLCQSVILCIRRRKSAAGEKNYLDLSWSKPGIFLCIFG